VLLAMAAIHRGHVFKFRLLNTAFISLLPKKLDDTGPSSLIHSIAKLITKILAKTANKYNQERKQ
jgi:hypothetical protein